MTVGSTCGAIIGALMVLGSVKGQELHEKNSLRALTKEVMNKIIERYGTIECRELKKNGISCSEMIEYSYSIVNKHLK